MIDLLLMPDILDSINPSLLTKNIVGIPVTFKDADSGGAWMNG